MAAEAVSPVGDGEFDTALPWVPLSDPRDATGQECEAGLVACQARLTHDEWRRACWMLEAARARADVTERWPEPDPRVIATALGWSVAMAASRLETAQGALERLPRLGAAMREGKLEHVKAAAFVAGLRDVTDEQANVVVDALISQAPKLGVWELQQRVAAAVKDVDPLGAENPPGRGGGPVAGLDPDRPLGSRRNSRVGSGSGDGGAGVRADPRDRRPRARAAARGGIVGRPGEGAGPGLSAVAARLPRRRR